MRTLREAGRSRLVQIGIRGSAVTRRDGLLTARHAASQPRAKVLLSNSRPVGQTPRAVTKSRCDFPETFPLPTRVPRARLNRGAELNAGGLRVGFEGLPGKPDSVQNDGQLSSYRDNRLPLTTFSAAFG